MVSKNSAFEVRYATSGRPPYAPRNMMGLILYGIMQGVTSLRGLEKLARIELGCMWVSGGIYPDHANIGRFIVMHEESLTGAFFDALTRSVLLKKTNSTGQCLAEDGTTIEAACSNYNLIKEEAAIATLEEARKQSEKDTENQKKQADLKKTTIDFDTFLDLKQKRKDRGRKSDETKVSLTEPEAIVQKMVVGQMCGKEAS